MNLQDDPGTAFRKALPDAAPPPARFDLDAIVRDGYRIRNRHRAALGGAVTTGVAAVAAVLALSVSGLPGGGADDDGPPAAADSPSAADTEIEDPSTAGYPYDENWGMDATGTLQAHEAQEFQDVKAAATAAFGHLLTEGGVWEDPTNPALDEECSWFDEQGEEAAQEEVNDCVASLSGMNVNTVQKPGNYGQTYLRSYQGGESEELETSLRTIFEFQLALPGGWTAEPGPVTEQLFPQHLISDGPYFTDEAPEFTTEDLDDGRTLMVADHGCAAEAAVIYPNGTGLRVTWNNCTGTDHPFDLDALTEAALSMPEMDLDTTGLAPVGELVEVPMGWVYDEDAWANSEEARSQAEATYAAARAALLELYPGASLEVGTPGSLGLMERGANMQRTYTGYGTLPIETTFDGVTSNVGFDLRYYLPGGWIPGYSETGHWDPHLTVCKEEFECTSFTEGDGTVWAFEERTSVYEDFTGEEGEVSTNHELYVTRYSPEGWAVNAWLQWTDNTAIDGELVGEILRVMPAPVYDAEATPEVPAG